MTQEKYFEDLNKVARRNQNRAPIVDQGLLKKTQKVVSNINLDDSKNIFLFFAAANYLNACVKQNREIGYSFKRKVGEALEVLAGRSCEGVLFYADRNNGGCVYISFSGFVFFVSQRCSFSNYQ